MALSSVFDGGWWLRRSWRALVLALAAVAGLAAAETASFPIPAQRDIGALFWADATGQAPLAAAQAAFDAGQGRPAGRDEIMPLGAGRAVWYRLEMPTVPKPVRAVFSVTFPGTDSVELFRPEADGGWHVQHAGDMLPVDQWPLRYLTPAFALTLQPGETQATYLRIRHSQAMRVVWELRDESTFLQEVELWHLGLGAYGGFLVMVVLVSIFNCVSWRDPIHLYYAVHAVLIGLSIMSLTGLGGAYLWPAWPWWNDQAPFLVPAAALGWAGLFVRELVAERGARIVSWLLLAHVAVTVAMMAVFIVVGRENLFRAPTVYFLPGLLLLLGVLTWYALRRPGSGLWILGGVVVMLAGSLAPLMHNLGVLPLSFLTLHGTQVGAALEIPLTLIGLYFRSRERRNNLKRMEALAHTDPLTGLGNHRVLLQRVETLLRRARRDPQRGALLRVHVLNLEDIRVEYGREAAEAALVRAAECVAREAGEGDLVAREQGNDLVLVMDGHASRSHTAEAARNIIARGLKFSRRLPPGVTLALRISGMCAPLPPDSDAPGVLATLNRLLLELGNDQRGRAVRITGAGEGAATGYPSSAAGGREPPSAPREETEADWAGGR
jgi:diguanylate cyclase (GGDEF)-like protein